MNGEIWQCVMSRSTSRRQSWAVEDMHTITSLKVWQLGVHVVTTQSGSAEETAHHLPFQARKKGTELWPHILRPWGKAGQAWRLDKGVIGNGSRSCLLPEAVAQTRYEPGG